MARVGDRDVRHYPTNNSGILRCSSTQPSPMPFSTASCTTPTGSSSRARACAKPPPSVTTLTPSPPPDLMSMPTREHRPRGGRDHRNPRPPSLGIPGRIRRNPQFLLIAREEEPMRLTFDGTFDGRDPLVPFRWRRIQRAQDYE